MMRAGEEAEASDSDEDAAEDAESGDVSAADCDEDDEDDEEFDFDSIADQAARAAELSAARASLDMSELGIDVGLGPEQLYVSGRGAFDTSAPPGLSRLDPRDFPESGLAAPAPEQQAALAREVRGAPARPLDDRVAQRKEARKRSKEQLEGWFGLKRQNLTPEVEKELKAIKLRANFDPKRFYKANDSKELPKYFTFATEIGGGMAPTGEAAPQQARGRTFLDSVLRDDKAQEWTRKKHSEVGARGNASVHSGHGKAQQGKKGAGTGRRGAAWKKTKKR